MSVLFCDFVGYTASAHSADPEDVRRILGEYHAGVRAVIERFGGTVEKFIGDAAVGVWGAPQAHEDDAERAVRAGLAIVDSVGVEVRVAVNTGEAFVRVRLGRDGKGMVVGDVVNTASRLQAVAPVGGVVVGEATVRTTGDVIEYESLAPVVLKGNRTSVEVWQAVAAIGGAAVRSPDGRRRSWAASASSAAAGGVRAGGRRAGPATSDGRGRAGHRKVAVGGGARGVACWAFGVGGDTAGPLHRLWRRDRLVAAGRDREGTAGISETESEEQARALLEEAVAGMADAAWLRARLAPLVGLPGEGGEREEVFAAWQRFFDEVAARDPLALMFEDLHWADPAMLAFIQYLAEWSTAFRC